MQQSATGPPELQSPLRNDDVAPFTTGGGRRVAFGEAATPDPPSPKTPHMSFMQMTDASGEQEGGSLKRNLHGPSILAPSRQAGGDAHSSSAMGSINEGGEQEGGTAKRNLHGPSFLAPSRQASGDAHSPSAMGSINEGGEQEGGSANRNFRGLGDAMNTSESPSPSRMGGSESPSLSRMGGGARVTNLGRLGDGRARGMSEAGDARAGEAMEDVRRKRLGFSDFKATESVSGDRGTRSASGTPSKSAAQLGFAPPPAVVAWAGVGEEHTAAQASRITPQSALTSSPISALARQRAKSLAGGGWEVDELSPMRGVRVSSPGIGSMRLPSSSLHASPSGRRLVSSPAALFAGDAPSQSSPGLRMQASLKGQRPASRAGELAAEIGARLSMSRAWGQEGGQSMDGGELPGTHGSGPNSSRGHTSPGSSEAGGNANQPAAARGPARRLLHSLSTLGTPIEPADGSAAQPQPRALVQEPVPLLSRQPTAPRDIGVIATVAAIQGEPPQPQAADTQDSATPKGARGGLLSVLGWKKAGSGAAATDGASPAVTTTDPAGTTTTNPISALAASASTEPPAHEDALPEDEQDEKEKKTRRKCCGFFVTPCCCSLLLLLLLIVAAAAIVPAILLTGGSLSPEDAASYNIEGAGLLSLGTNNLSYETEIQGLDPALARSNPEEFKRLVRAELALIFGVDPSMVVVDTMTIDPDPNSKAPIKVSGSFIADSSGTIDRLTKNVQGMGTDPYIKIVEGSNGALSAKIVIPPASVQTVQMSLQQMYAIQGAALLGDGMKTLAYTTAVSGVDPSLVTTNRAEFDALVAEEIARVFGVPPSQVKIGNVRVDPTSSTPVVVEGFFIADSSGTTDNLTNNIQAMSANPDIKILQDSSGSLNTNIVLPMPGVQAALADEIQGQELLSPGLTQLSYTAMVDDLDPALVTANQTLFKELVAAEIARVFGISPSQVRIDSLRVDPTSATPVVVEGLFIAGATNTISTLVSNIQAMPANPDIKILQGSGGSLLAYMMLSMPGVQAVMADKIQGQQLLSHGLSQMTYTGIALGVDPALVTAFPALYETLMKADIATMFSVLAVGRRLLFTLDPSRVRIDSVVVDPTPGSVTPVVIVGAFLPDVDTGTIDELVDNVQAMSASPMIVIRDLGSGLFHADVTLHPPQAPPGPIGFNSVATGCLEFRDSTTTTLLQSRLNAASPSCWEIFLSAYPNTMSCSTEACTVKGNLLHLDVNAVWGWTFSSGGPYKQCTLDTSNPLYRTIEFMGMVVGGTPGCRTNSKSMLGGYIESTPIFLFAGQSVSYTFQGLKGGDWFDFIIAMYTGQVSQQGDVVSSYALRGYDMGSTWKTGTFPVATTGWYYFAAYVASYDYTGGKGTGCTVSVGAFSVN
ncbi:hypothetical protein FOA52_005578 [Chlamydomonas sp. UWO 241]|nr:hypothetical protein FOA52_005578 [Chlamydomonas sp. UWO 241]